RPLVRVRLTPKVLPTELLERDVTAALHLGLAVILLLELLADLVHPAGELLIDATPLPIRLHRTTSDAAGFLDAEALRNARDDGLLGRERGLVLRAHPCHPEPPPVDVRRPPGLEPGDLRGSGARRPLSVSARRLVQVLQKPREELPSLLRGNVRSPGDRRPHSVIRDAQVALDDIGELHLADHRLEGHGRLVPAMPVLLERRPLRVVLLLPRRLRHAVQALLERALEERRLMSHLEPEITPVLRRDDPELAVQQAGPLVDGARVVDPGHLLDGTTGHPIRHDELVQHPRPLSGRLPGPLSGLDTDPLLLVVRPLGEVLLRLPTEHSLPPLESILHAGAQPVDRQPGRVNPEEVLRVHQPLPRRASRLPILCRLTDDPRLIQRHRLDHSFGSTPAARALAMYSSRPSPSNHSRYSEVPIRGTCSSTHSTYSRAVC